VEQLPPEPRDRDGAELATVVSIVSASETDIGQHSMKHRNVLWQGFKVAQAVWMRDALRPTGDEDDRAVERGEDRWVGFEQPAVPDAHGGDAFILGTRVRLELDEPAGSPNRPARDAEFIAKFKHCCQRARSNPAEGAIVAWIERVMTIERVPDAGELARSLRSQ